MPGIFETLFGRGDKTSQLPTLNPQQQQGLQQILQQMQQSGGQGGNYSQANDWLSKILSGDQDAFSQFEAPYRNQFEQQTLPGIAERFAGLNAMGGGLSSSGFGQALGSAGAGLQAQLAGLHGNLRNQASQQAFGQYNQLGNQGLGTRGFENLYQPGNGGLFGGAAQGIGSGLGMGLGMGVGNFLGGGGVGQAAGGLMSQLKSLFGMS